MVIAVKKTSTRSSTALVTTLEFTKSTKGTHVYANHNDDAPIPTIYIRKSAFKGTPPSIISITVSKIK